jgi:glycosyltransferase involved in cell wall biosynthesis
MDIVSRLDRTRFEPLVVCPEEGDLPRRLTELGVETIVHPLSRLTRAEALGFLVEVPWYMRLLRSRKIALVHGNASASRRSLGQAAALCRVPYVQHVRNPVRETRGRFGFRVASRIVANSDATAAKLREDEWLSRKTVTIYNAVDLHRYEERDDRRTELGSGDRPVIGFVGQIVPRKGVTTLIRALPMIREHFPSALLAIVGCPPPDETEYEQECLSLARQLGVEPHVRFLGYRRDVPAWMRSFDVFALPTRAEPFGKVVIEAMAAACPVVVTAVGGIPEIVVNSTLGTLVPPDDPRAVADGVLAYLHDPAHAARVGDAARQHVFRSFGLDAMIDRLQGLYDSVLSEATAGSGGKARD